MAQIVAADHRHLVDRFRALAGRLPDYPAITFLERGEEPASTLSFHELDRKARSLAAWFQQRDARGARAIMLFDAGVELVYGFLGCAYGQVVGAPMPAPASNKLDRYLVRVQNVIRDGDARFVLTTAAIKDRLQSVAGAMPGFEQVEWVAVDELDDLSSAWVEEAIDTSQLVYLQYTSGSTSIPKGVMITHHNLMSVVRYIDHVGAYAQQGSAAVCWMPYFHDFGLIDGLLVPLAHGMPVYLMSPFDFVQHPIRWLQAVHRFRVSHSGGPNFSFDLVARKSTPEERASLDLSHWRRANNCAEPIRWSSVQRFLDAFGPCGFAAEAMAPMYALAEATLAVSMADGAPRLFRLDPEAFEQHRASLVAEGAAARHLVGCGQVFSGSWQVDARIVHPDSREALPDGEVGEVWVHGDVVAKGYWNKPVETEEKFRARIVGVPDRDFMRTGDMGFMLDGELVITGRRKDLIIVEGRNHYPQDIEATVEKALDCLRPGCSIAFSVETEEQVHVVLVCELKSGFVLAEDAEGNDAAHAVERKELERAIRREVSQEHQLRVHDIVFLTPGLLPKTTSGKVERSGCRSKYISGALMHGVPRR
ncbi:fatty acyl-AMP ligase [Dyella sp. LX-66]|uniref:fatty acyl-AMP ligase n=1 Tax=unclassified Dyella TaxID=2634549 RepID=UPI001BE0B21C|nr:fatty acyl-AMP ligase [Dyella sp. LX-1]MBT2140122.1 fatty acyl-AMP ligase [Dyella sp. LX-66]